MFKIGQPTVKLRKRQKWHRQLPTDKVILRERSIQGLVPLGGGTHGTAPQTSPTMERSTCYYDGLGPSTKAKRELLWGDKAGSNAVHAEQGCEMLEGQ
jgi:hypothetical protein